MGSSLTKQLPEVPTAGAAALIDPSLPLRTLRETFRLENFQPGQREVIESLLAGRSAAAVFPTGGGKSLCYQLPSQLLPGTTLVVSPLISLMKDQCDALAKRGVAAARLDSSLSQQEFTDAMRGVREGRIKLLYAAPERFFNERFRASLGDLRVSLFAVDEAHCISRWGHNFRPDYLKLAELAGQLNAERVLALTATATPDVLSDICRGFDIAPEDAVRTPFFRPNLHLRSRLLSAAARDRALVEAIRERPPGPTIVYVSLQRTAEETAEMLAGSGIEARPYHAGLADEVRAETQQWFFDSENPVITATIAFGMGIDKPNVRYIYHYNPPASPEGYAQEIGRAGRDGNDSICEILLVPEDRIVLENFVYGDTPSRQAVGRLVDLVMHRPETFYLSHYRLSQETDIRVLVVRTLLTYLELDGYIAAIGPRYDSYKVKPLVSSKHILSHFSGEKREFLAGMLACLTKSRTWFSLNMAAAGRRLDCPRERLVKAVEYLAERGWVEVQVSDLVHGYRSLKPAGDVKVLADTLYQRMIQRERAELARVDGVFDLAEARTCLASWISAHFGEPLAEPCGRCTNCRGEGPWKIPPPAARKVGTSAMTVMKELCRKYPDHFADARSRARFLCGLSGPAFIKARLSRHPSFGVCTGVPFGVVLEEMKSTMQTA